MFQQQVEIPTERSSPDLDEKPINMSLAKRSSSPASLNLNDSQKRADLDAEAPSPVAGDQQSQSLPNEAQLTSALMLMLQNALKTQQSLPQFPFKQPQLQVQLQLQQQQQQQADQLADWQKLFGASIAAADPNATSCSGRLPLPLPLPLALPQTGASYTINNLLGADGVEAKRRKVDDGASSNSQTSPNEHDNNNNGNQAGANAAAPASPAAAVQKLQEALFRTQLQALAKQNDSLREKLAKPVDRSPPPVLPFSPLAAFSGYPFGLLPQAEPETKTPSESSEQKDASSLLYANSTLNQLANELKKEFIAKLTDFVDDLVTKIELHKQPSSSNGDLTKQELLSALHSRLSGITCPELTVDDRSSAASFSKVQCSPPNSSAAAAAFLFGAQNASNESAKIAAAASAAAAAAAAFPLLPPFAPLDALTAQLAQLAQANRTGESSANVSPSPSAIDMFKSAGQFPPGILKAVQQPTATDESLTMQNFMTHAQLSGFLSSKRKRTKVTDTRIAGRQLAMLQQQQQQQQPSGSAQQKTKSVGASFDLPTFYRNAHAHLVSLGMSSLQNPFIDQAQLVQNGATMQDSVPMPLPLPMPLSVSPSSPADHTFSGSQQALGRFTPDLANTATAEDTYSNSSDDKLTVQTPNDQSDPCYQRKFEQTSILTPMHLRKAKLMFFYARYPSSSILKVYFPDVKFNKNNTAQLVKWFSNFREFYYIQMEKYARQAIARSVKNAEELVVTTESELYNVLNLHYNRNNQIEVPEAFRSTVETTLREFFKAISVNKDQEPSWKKAIYKIIARLDQPVPEFFKCPDWYNQLSGHNLSSNSMVVSCNQ